MLLEKIVDLLIEISKGEYKDEIGHDLVNNVYYVDLVEYILTLAELNDIVDE